MKAPAYSAAPLSGEPEKKKLSFRELLLGQKKNERCFSAEDPGHSVCLLWMESSHFGSRYAYPVLVWERGAEALRYDSAPTAEAGENNRRLMERWLLLHRLNLNHLLLQLILKIHHSLQALKVTLLH